MTQSLAQPRSRTRLTALVAALTLFAMLVGIAPRPAKADSASTTAVLLGGAAAVAAILISNNIRHKQQQANTPVGRTQDGGTILGDGRIVYPNGDVLRTGNNGQACTFDGYGVPCTNNPTVYYPRGYDGGRHDNGHHYGQFKHHHHRDNDDNQGDEGNRGHGRGHGDDD